MEGAISFMLCLIFLGVVVFMLGIVYRNRVSISKWLNTPYYAEEDRKLKLQRRIEDAQAELTEIEKAETKD